MCTEQEEKRRAYRRCLESLVVRGPGGFRADMSKASEMVARDLRSKGLAKLEDNKLRLTAYGTQVLKNIIQDKTRRLRYEVPAGVACQPC